jgi:hypothetical protein
MPLAFTDAGLAHLVLAANRIAPEHRGRWLQRIAHELEHPPSATARRLRRYQLRRRNGQACYRIVQDQVELEELLLAAGTLAPADRDDHRQVEAALARFLSLCILDHRNAFQPDREIYDRVRIELGLTALQKALSHAAPKRVRK